MALNQSRMVNLLHLSMAVLALAVVSNSVPLVMPKITARFEKGPELHPECQNIQGINEEDTYHLRQNCEVVYRNEYIKWSEEMLADEDFVKGLKVIDVTDHGPDDPAGIVTRPKRSTEPRSECPVFDHDYLENALKPKQRSTSPWEYFISEDQSRRPVKILNSTCLCEGCIDLNSGQEDIVNLASMPLPLEIPVWKGRDLQLETVHLACTCIIPIVTSAGD